MSHFSEATHISFGARLKNAIKGIGLGISFIGIAVYFLFWNEGNSVQTARALAQGEGQVVALNNAAIDPAYDGSLIHVSGPLTLSEQLFDAALGVGAGPKAVRLERRVEQYAWIEEKRSATETNLGGSQEKTTEYTYRKGWTDSPASGAEFRIPDGHLNPPLPIKSRVFRQPNGAIGAFVINDRVSDLGGAKEMLLTGEQMASVQAALALARPAKRVAGQAVFSADVANPEVGDIRIGYFASDIEEASVVGLQQGNRLIPFTAESGRKIYLVEKGLRNAQEMFQTAADANRLKTWMLRAGLMVLLFLGFKALLSLVDVVASVLPFLGWITSGVTSLVSLALTLAVGGATMAVAWFYFRPLLSLTIFGIALAGAAASAWRVRKTAQDTPEIPPEVSNILCERILK